jgi:branched-chain amino acid aminotransferase
MPVTRVNATTIGNGQPGPITRKLVETYWAWHKLPQYSSAIEY